MAEEPKVYHAETIEENPFPNQEQPESFADSQSTAGGVTSGKTIQAQPFPYKKIIGEFISKSLNTISRKITSAFQFTQSGAIQIGKYILGISGDIRISPDGITARNKSGEDTFALDGTTGDAFFKGTVQSGSVVSGDIIVGGEDNGSGTISVLDETNAEKVTLDKDGIVVTEGKITVKDSTNTTIIDAVGLVSDANFRFENANATDNITTTLTTYNYMSDTQIQFSLERETNVLVICTVIVGIVGFDTNPFTVSAVVNIDSTDYVPGMFIQNEYNTGWGSTLTTNFVTTLTAGDHTALVNWKVGGTDNTAYCLDRSLTILMLGK
jgi:hypothetical protein